MSLLYNDRHDKVIKTLLDQNIKSLSSEFYKIFDKTDYVSTYSKLSYTAHTFNNKLRFTLLVGSDLVTNLVLVLPKIFSINLINRVELLIGDNLINTIFINDIHHKLTKILYPSNDLYDTYELINSNNSDEIIILLSLLTEMIPFLKLYKNEIYIDIILDKDDTNNISNISNISNIFNRINKSNIYRKTDIKLYGTKYDITNMTKRKKFYEESYNFLTVQTQYIKNQQINIGRNKIIINFNNPIFLLSICGLNKSNILNIHLKLIPFEYISEYDTDDIFFELNYEEIYPNLIIIYFSNKLNTENLFLNESINFSKFCQKILIIHTKQEHINCYVDILAFNKNISVYSKGKYSLQFSS